MPPPFVLYEGLDGQGVSIMRVAAPWLLLLMAGRQLCHGIALYSVVCSNFLKQLSWQCA